MFVPGGGIGTRVEGISVAHVDMLNLRCPSYIWVKTSGR